MNRTRVKVLMVAVLILVLGLTCCNREQTNTVETTDELLGKFIDYFVKEDSDIATKYLLRAIELDPTKNVYNKILKYINNGNYAEALQLLEQRKDQSPGEQERKGMQILVAYTHFQWAS